MKENGFTLIELLAVIIILGIIALIAVPIIVNVIDDAEAESELRSAELYIGAVNIAIMDKNMSERFTNGTCTVQTNGYLDCDGTTITVVVNNAPTAGTLTIENRRVTAFEGLKIADNTYKTDANGKIVLES